MIPIDQAIILNEVECKMAEYVCKQRHQGNRDAGVEDKKIGPQSAYQTDLEGFSAEIAFCKMMNVYPDLSLGPRKYGVDAVSGSGWRIDVKSTTWPNGRLVVAPWKKDDEEVQMYALMVGRFPNYRFAGFHEAEVVTKEENLTDLGCGPTYAMEQQDLQFGLL